MNRKPPSLICSKKGEWWTHLNPNDHSGLARLCIARIEDINGPMPAHAELIPEFQQWLDANDPGHSARPLYGMVLVTFSGENAAMMFRLLTNAVVRRCDQ